MEVIERFASEEQTKKWLDPSLEGTIRYEFAITEPDVAHTDATHIASHHALHGAEGVMNRSTHDIYGDGA